MNREHNPLLCIPTPPAYVLSMSSLPNLSCIQILTFNLILFNNYSPDSVVFTFALPFPNTTPRHVRGATFSISGDFINPPKMAANRKVNTDATGRAKNELGLRTVCKTASRLSPSTKPSSHPSSVHHAIVNARTTPHIVEITIAF